MSRDLATLVDVRVDDEVPESTNLPEAWENLTSNPNTNAELAYEAWRLLSRATSIVAVPETGTLRVCRDGVWDDDGDDVLRQAAARMMGSDYSTGVRRELEEQFLVREPVHVDELGTPKGTIAVENGLLKLSSRERRPLEPEDYALHKLPVAHEPSAGCPRWRSFLERVTSSEADRRRLQEFVGYCLAGGRPWLKKALMILGPTDAGKTVFLDVVEVLFGEEANAAQTPQYLANQRWGVDQLANKPVNIRHDVDAGRIQELGVLKEIIDGNLVTAEQKGEDPYQFRPETRLLFAANQAPERTRDDQAFWNRWLTVVFPESIPKEEQADKRELMAELTDELPGVLNWALDGLDRLRENGGFTDEQAPDEVRRRWERYGSPIERFKQQYLTRSVNATARKDKVRKAFEEFAWENGHEDISDKQLTEELTKAPGIGTAQRRIGGVRQRVYTGVQLKWPGAGGEDSELGSFSS